MGGIEAKKLKSPGHFRYEFLDPFRPMISKKYVLVDEALDYVGNSLCWPKYPKTPEHFGQCGNVPPSDNPEPGSNANWRIRHPVFPDFYDPAGIRLRFTTQGTCGLETAPPPSPKVAAFRDKSWSKLSRFIQNKTVNPIYFVPGGIAWPMKGTRYKQMKIQRDLVQNTGCMWYETAPGSSHLVLVLFAHKQLEAAVNAQLGRDTLVTKPDESEFADGVVVDRLICEVLDFCASLGAKTIISKPGMWSVVNELIGDDQTLKQSNPRSNAWKKVCNDASPEISKKAFCKAGKNCVVGSEGMPLKDFVDSFLDHRNARIETRT